MWTGTRDSTFPTIDVLHKEGKPPTFTAGSRLLYHGLHKEAEAFSFRRGSNKNNNGQEAARSMDAFFKTVFGLLLPVMVASALDDTTDSHHHHHHKHHKHEHQKEHKHEQANQDGHKHVTSVLRRSTTESAFVTVPAEARTETLSNIPLLETSEPADISRSGHYGAAGFLLLTALAVLLCVAIVVAWRALFVRKLSKNCWKNDDTQLAERPHIQ